MQVDVTKFREGDKVEHFIYGNGEIYSRAPSLNKNGFWTIFGENTIFFTEDGKRHPADVRHGFIAHTPIKRKKTAEVDVWVNVYKDSFSPIPSTDENHFIAHASKDGAIEGVCHSCVAVAVPSKLIVGEWEE